jgi:Thrombospondin type 3 repeat
MRKEIRVKVKKILIGILVLGFGILGACGGGHGHTTSGGGTGITTATTFQGTLVDGGTPVAGVAVCIQGTNPLVCATTDQNGNFSVAADVLGQVILSFGNDGILSLCLSGVPEGATITLGDVACTVADGLCTPASIDVTPVPAVAIEVCNATSPTPTPTPVDSDGDGKPDDSDLCPGTPPGDVVDADGCSVGQLVPCNGDWSSHGDYVAAFTQKANDFVQGGLLTPEQRDALVEAASASDCGGSGAGTPTPTPTPNPQPDDDDGDGVANENDACPNTPPGEPVDSQGCSVGQLVPCDGAWNSHGDYVSAVVATANDFFDAGLISEEQRNALVEAAAQSECGKSEGDPTPTPTPTVTPSGQLGDADGDGVADGDDACPGTAPQAPVNGAGCSLDQLVPCDGNWRNHGEYVSTLAALSQEFVDAGLITNDERAAIVAAAAQSSCGKIDGPDATPTPDPVSDPQPGDTDGDGVADGADSCPDTPAGAIVDAQGCSVSQLAQCGGDWLNHGDYVSAVAHVTQEFVDAGLLTSQQRANLVSEAAQSDCGKPLTA